MEHNSRSPNRHSRKFSKSSDALLRDLSPSTTLRAFTAASSPTAGNSSDELVRSIEAASASERAVGARIAQTCSDIRAMYAEMNCWHWDGTFEPPPENEKAAVGARMLEKHHNAYPEEPPSMHASQASDKDKIEFWGSLPQEMVTSYEQRVEDIRNALEELGVEELKTHVLHVHVPSRSLQSTYHPVDSRNDMASNLQQLDDFTALITATILQALPILSRLYKLLDTWAARLAVLQKLPDFLHEMSLVKQQIEAAWASMAHDLQDSQLDTGDLRANFDKTHARLGRKVTKLAARLDSVLDDLEGRQDTIPDTWIDAFEALEASYGEWVLSGQREIMAREFDLLAAFKPDEHATKANSPSTSPVPDNVPRAAGSSLVSPSQDSQEASASNAPPRQHDIGLGIEFSDFVPSEDGQGAILSSQEPAATLQVSGEPLEIAESPVLGTRTMARMYSHDTVSSINSDIDRSATSTPDGAPSNEEENVQQKRRTSSSRTRHVPIITAYDEGELTVAPPSLKETRARDEVLSSGMATPPVMKLPTLQDNDVERSALSTPALEGMSQRSSSDNVRARAAFLNGGLEERQRLQRAKAAAPVRSFEHASSAFTKLFNRANSAQADSTQPSRSSSASSKSSSIRRGFGIGNRSGSGQSKDRPDTSMSSLRSVGAPLPRKESPTSAETDAAPDRLQGQARNFVTVAARKTDSAFVTPETQYGFEPSTGDSKSTIESVWDSPDPNPFPDNWPLPAQLDADQAVYPMKSIEDGSFGTKIVSSVPTSPVVHQIQLNPDETLASPKNEFGHTRQSRSTHSFFPRIAYRGPPPPNVPGILQTPSKPVTPSTPMSPATQTSAATSRRPSQGSSQPETTYDQDMQYRARQASTAFARSSSKSSMNVVNIHDQPRLALSSSAQMRAVPATPSLASDSKRTSANEGPEMGELIIGYSPSTETCVSEQYRGAPTPPSPTLAVNKRRQHLLIETGLFGPTGEDPTRPTTTKKHRHKKTLSNAESLDRQVSRVISSLPTQIRFTPIATESPLTPEPLKPLNSSNVGSLKNRQALLSKSSARTPSNGGLTLSPAKMDEKSRRSRSSTDPEVKLYHLSQDGERQPIKLYVRLVGEGERVMVRVGGGWADLGEYLRQYAEHHGHRTVSEGSRLDFAVANAAAAVNGNSIEKPTTASAAKRSTPLSRPSSALEHNRPLSRLSMAARPESPAMVFAMDSHNSHYSTPTRPSTANTTTSITSSADENNPQGRGHRLPPHQGHIPPATLTLSLTPHLTHSSSTRPKTADPSATFLANPFSAASSSSPQWSGPEIGLAGPTASSPPRRRADTIATNNTASPPATIGGAAGGALPPDLSGHKARWVDEMIARAKTATTNQSRAGGGRSSKSRSGTVGSVGDVGGQSGGSAATAVEQGGQGWGSLGRVGGTKRIVFRKS